MGSWRALGWLPFALLVVGELTIRQLCDSQVEGDASASKVVCAAAVALEDRGSRCSAVDVAGGSARRSSPLVAECTRCDFFQSALDQCDDFKKGVQGHGGSTAFLGVDVCGRGLALRMAGDAPARYFAKDVASLLSSSINAATSANGTADMRLLVIARDLFMSIGHRNADTHLELAAWTTSLQPHSLASDAALEPGLVWRVPFERFSCALCLPGTLGGVGGLHSGLARGVAQESRTRTR
jgi:hypothetical protein